MSSSAQLDMLEKIRSEAGFIAALDQSGGSTPKALRVYGVMESDYSGDDEMFQKVHEMRTRIITSKEFTGERVLGAILFENTLDREIAGKPSAKYLWQVKHIVPFLKVDKGLQDEVDGTQLLKPITNLNALLVKATNQDVFGTKMRSVIKLANEKGIEALVAQQFEVSKQILAAGLVPIIEPEIDIHSPEKLQAEVMLKAALLKHLDSIQDDERVMFKVTLPEIANFYRELVEHPKVLKLVALSGGYDREEANQRLTENKGMIASFSRALTEGISCNQSETEFDHVLNTTLDSICKASKT